MKLVIICLPHTDCDIRIDINYIEVTCLLPDDCIDDCIPFVHSIINQSFRRSPVDGSTVFGAHRTAL